MCVFSFFGGTFECFLSSQKICNSRSVESTTPNNRSSGETLGAMSSLWAHGLENMFPPPLCIYIHGGEHDPLPSPRQLTIICTKFRLFRHWPQLLRGLKKKSKWGMIEDRSSSHWDQCQQSFLFWQTKCSSADKFCDFCNSLQGIDVFVKTHWKGLFFTE